MYPTILVPLDDSEQTRRILPYVTRLASAGGKLVLLQVVSDFALTFHAEDLLARLAEQLAMNAISTETSVEVGEPTRAIVDSATRVHADLIAMASDRWADLDRWLNGSVADWVLRHTTLPVLLAAPNCAPEAWPADRGPSIMVALDGSPLAEQALDPVIRMARLLGSQVVLTRAVGSEQTTAYSEAQRYLDDIIARLPATQVQAMSRVLVGSPEKAIQEMMDTVGVDMIAMATHGRSGLARVVLGSIATRTLQWASVPVLLVRPTTVTPFTEASHLTTSDATPDRSPMQHV